MLLVNGFKISIYITGQLGATQHIVNRSDTAIEKLKHLDITGLVFVHANLFAII